MIKTTRLLLPFTHGVGMDTIEAAVILAASHRATLVPLSLITTLQGRGKGARLEHIQQSKDFLEAVQQKALQHCVPLERFEVFTGDVVKSISILVHQLKCDGVVLVLRGRNGSLLSAETIKQIMAMKSCPLYVMYLPSRESSWVSRLREGFSHWWPGYRQRADGHVQRQPALEEQAIQQVALARQAGSPELERPVRS
ncbi:MAG TPA: universal stress protein [Ktedonobacteraceae bacterium]|nr:universal stress protein [Ktedonobacteraceae bacterium]